MQHTDSHQFSLGCSFFLVFFTTVSAFAHLVVLDECCSPLRLLSPSRVFGSDDDWRRPLCVATKLNRKCHQTNQEWPGRTPRFAPAGSLG